MKRLRRRLRRFQPTQGIVLCYHRVASLERDPQLLAVTPEHFAKQLAYLSEHLEPVPLDRIGDGEPSSAPHFAVTFDDGYVDNLLAAKPLLEEYRVPSTVFVCTGNLGTTREFWWDELERILLEPEALPKQLDIAVHGARISSELPDDGPSAPAWNVQNETASPRQALYRKIASLIRPLPPSERDAIVAELRSWAGLPDAGRNTHRSLTEREVETLAASPCVQIGAHTVGHPVLASLSAEAQSHEIEASRSRLKELTGRPVDSFAYPYGGENDFNASTVRILRESGVRSACTTTPEPVVTGTELLRIPRFLIRDWDPADLQQRLEPFLRR